MSHAERKVAVSNLEQNNDMNEDEKKEQAVSKESEDKTEVTAGEEQQSEAPEEAAAETNTDSGETAVAAPEEAADTDTAESGETEEAGDDRDPVAYYTEIVDRAKELVVQTDWAFVTTELSNLAHNITEGPDSSSDESKALVEEFEQLREDFEEKKKAHYEELNRRKAENLDKKKALLKSLSEIVNEENWTATREVGKIKGQWESIKVLPQGEGEPLDKRFAELMSEFEDHKVDRLVKKLQKEEENLELKLLVLDKMESLIPEMKKEDADYDSLNKQFESLLGQWRKIGRVPSDKNQGTWDRFNEAQDAFNEMRFKYDKEYRKSIEKALEKKKKLIKQAEALVDQDNIAKAARKVNKLHRAWKKAGNLPQKEENEMWDQFKHATDAFNQKKSDNIELLREQEQKNLDKKMELINQASEIKDTDDFDKGHSQMQSLMDRWKNIGPVPRKKSSKIWKQFKGEMDVFYERRRENFKSIRKDHKENLEKKNEILKKLEELGTHDDPALAVEEAKKLQSDFKDVGHVPIKMKNTIWKQYREACDVIYDRYRALGSDLGRERKLASQGVDPESRKEIIKYEKEVKKLKKEVSGLESEVIQWQEAKTYFKPTNKGNKLLDELQNKIEKAQSKIEDKEDTLYDLQTKIRKLKETEDDSDEPESGSEEENKGEE